MKETTDPSISEMQSDMAKFKSFFSVNIRLVNIYGETAIMLFIAMPNSTLPTNFQLNIFIFEARVSLQILAREFFRQFFKLFCLEKYAKRPQKLFVAMSNSRLRSNFQLNIFIFEATTSHQTLPKPLKQNANKLARLRNNPN